MKFYQLLLAGLVGGGVAAGVQHFVPNGAEKSTQSIEAPQFARVNASPSIPDISFVDASKTSTAAVVHIKSIGQSQEPEIRTIEDLFFYRGYSDEPKVGTGSGVLISEDGYIVTNNHVVGFANQIIVTLNEKEYEATKIGTDPSTDLAVIKIQGSKFNYLQYANSDQIEVGEWVIAVGNPFNLTSTVTAGIISAKGRNIDIIQSNKKIEEFIQTDAVVNPGNSGGALVNTKGQLVGINTAISSPTGVYAGYSFAIPSNLVKRVVDEILQYGDIERANLGVAVAPLEYLKDHDNLKTDHGMVVAKFTYGSSAMQAGIELGDVITKVNNKNIEKYEDLKEALKFVKVGDQVNVEILRNNNFKTVKVKFRKGI